MLSHDPRPWLLRQTGPAAVRARRALGVALPADADAARDITAELAGCRLADGSFAGSPMRTAGVLCLLSDLRPDGCAEMVASAAEFLMGVLESQPGYAAGLSLTPGGLQTPCDLGGFFGPYDRRALPEVMADGAREMNHFREFEPLVGPQSPVREAPRSSLDRAGPSSCYAWGLIPLSYCVEALCRSGHGRDERARPAINALMAAQHDGGWCRNLGRHPGCSMHAARALAAHPDLRETVQAEQALGFLRTTGPGYAGEAMPFCVGTKAFALLDTVSRFDLDAARPVIEESLPYVAKMQKRDGSFGGPHAVERVAAVLRARAAVERAEPVVRAQGAER